LHGRHGGSLNALPGLSDLKTYEKLRVAWAREETWINQSLNALLTALPESVVCELLRDRVDGLSHALGVERLYSAGIADVTGDPDFIIRSDTHCVLGEVKVATHHGSHRYSFKQFTKYMMLAALSECARDPHVRRRATHIILVPSTDPKEFCLDFGSWRPTVVAGNLVVDPMQVRPKVPRWPVSDFEQWQSYFRRSLLGKSVRSRCDIDPGALEALLGRNNPVLVPTVVMTWSEFATSARRLCQERGFQRLASAATRLGKMACPKTSLSES